jgi:phenylpropionate dioxygenase-like ring-hydroxylating dioxygenase large terminal subunit
MDKAAQVPPTFQKTTATFATGARSLPQRYFVSRDVFAEEQDRIFSKQWVLVGHQSQLAEAGDYFVAAVARESLIIVRDKGGEVHGFYNVCRHRGSRLIENTNGQLSAAIQCPYHAWTYALDGRLLGAPHMDDVSGFDKADYSLHRVNLGLWQGFIFVNLAEAGALTSSCISATSRSARPLPRGGTGQVAVPDSSILSQSNSSALTGASRPSLPEGEKRDRRPQDGFVSLEDWFAPLKGKFSHWNMSMLQPAKRIEYDVRANWKLMFENYSQCYHWPGVHPQLQKVSPYDSAENDLTEGPFLGGFMKINPGKSLTMSGNACAAFVGKIENLQQVFYYSIFPNMLLSLHPEYVMVHQLWPQSPERTLIVCDWLFHPDAFGRKEFNPQDAIEFWDMTNKHDWHVCELSQHRISSCAYVPGP